MPDPLASRLVVGLAGASPTGEERAWLRRWSPAGVILFSRNIIDNGQLHDLCVELRGLLPAGAEIVADHEGGAVSALAAALGRPPAAWGLGVLDDPGLTRAVHREMGKAAAAAGLTRLLAPCADTLVEPRNRVIGARSFGADAGLAARHAAAAVAGLIEGGVGACPKHWPGHGGAAADSHLEAAVIGAGAVAEPFSAGMEAGADAMMLGHLAVAADAAPATLDPAAVAAARDFAPGAALWADDVTMGALRPHLEGALRGGISAEGLADPASLPREWFAAVAAGGCDRLLCRGIPWTAFPLGPESGLDPVWADRAEPLAGSEWAAAAGAAAGPAAAEARRRLASGVRFPDRPWVWLDALAGDRWGDLAPTSWTEAGLPAPALRLAGSDSAAAVGKGADEPRTGLVVTSHRPLDSMLSGGRKDVVRILKAAALSDRGICLTIGHPSLAREVRGLLPPGWRIGSLYESSMEQLAALAEFYGRPGCG